MRTTLTLDEDVAAKLKAKARRLGKSFKQVVNETLRLGFVSAKPGRLTARFEVRARKLGLRQGFDYDRVSELLDTLDGPAIR